MAQPPLHLIIGNYNTSSWSLRAWLVLRLARLAFVETRIPLRLPETPERIGRYSPSGKLPVLLAEGVPIWDSLAIAEFIAELEPGIWPLDPIARAEARSISAEVHSGFAELRRLMPMDIVGRFNAPGRLPLRLAAEIRRVMTIVEHCRARFAPEGPFLFGAFSIADAMMAPVATRLVTHGVPLAGAVEDYVDSLMAWPDMVTWCDAAAAEQAEREATGGLAVLSVTRPGRVLGPEPAASEAAPSLAVDAVPDDGPGTAAAEPPPSAAEETIAPAAEPVAAPAERPEPALTAFATRTDQRPAEAGAAAPQRSAEPPPPAPAAPAAPPRRRLFEAASADASDAGAAPPAGAAPAVRDAPEPAPAGKLGWLRRGVPAEHFDRVAGPVDEAAASPVADRPDAVMQPPVPEARPNPAPAAAPPRPAARPTTPAIKPIGGGILRRR